MRASVIRLGILKRPAPAFTDRQINRARPPCQAPACGELACGRLHASPFRRRPTRMNDKRNGLTYAQAGVDIDAGNRMVELIKPLVRATARPGADAEIGGFGGLFDLKRAGLPGPDPGRRNRRRRHQADDRDRDRAARHDRHRPGRDVGQRHRGAGRRAAVLSRLFRLRQARAGGRRRGRAGRSRRPAARRAAR